MSAKLDKMMAGNHFVPDIGTVHLISIVTDDNAWRATGAE